MRRRILCADARPLNLVSGDRERPPEGQAAQYQEHEHRHQHLAMAFELHRRQEPQHEGRSSAEREKARQTDQVASGCQSKHRVGRLREMDVSHSQIGVWVRDVPETMISERDHESKRGREQGSVERHAAECAPEAPPAPLLLEEVHGEHLEQIEIRPGERTHEQSEEHRGHGDRDRERFQRHGILLTHPSLELEVVGLMQRKCRILKLRASGCGLRSAWDPVNLNSLRRVSPDVCPEKLAAVFYRL